MSEPFRKARDLFERALELPVAERQDFVARETSEEPALARTVLQLLAAHELDDGLLDSPPVQTPPAPRRFGVYRILGEIGQGGMGAVWKAVRDDDAFEKTVAIKVISGLLHTRSLARFRREREILARLEHPNIARILDGGTESETPFLVMEYVDGERIDHYCQMHSLDLRARLRLFLQVCAAADYAHRNLVVHRDIKPGNVLVTSDGTVKLLDFGIAKLVGDDLEETQSQTLQFTPDYASPEQIRGEPVTPATDVYSLGVLLYELLTGGTKPRRTTGRGLADLLENLQHDPPAPPSSHGHPALKGDLDAIALSALAPDPERRYPSAAKLAEDVRNYLDGHPVTARTDSVAYVFRKFLRRHWLPVAASAAILATLGIAVVVTARQARIAETRYREVRTLATTILFDIHDRIRTLAGATEARRITVDTALRYLDALHQQSFADPSLQAELASAYQRAGDLFGDISDVTLEGARSALPLYSKALALRTELARRNPGDRGAQEALAKAHERVGVGQLGVGQAAAALASFEKALSLTPANTPLHPDLTSRIASAQLALGQNAKAVATIEETLAELDANASRMTPLDRTRLMARTLRQQGIMLWFTGENERAAPALEEALRLTAEWMRLEPQLSAPPRQYASAVPILGRVYQSLGRHREAEELFEKARSALDRLGQSSPTDPQIVLPLAYTLKHLAWIKYNRQPPGGEAEMAAALATLARMVARAQAGTAEMNEYADTLLKTPFASQRNNPLALEVATRMIRIAGDRNPMLLDTLAWAYFRNGEKQLAIETMEKALALLPKQSGDRTRQEAEAGLRTFQAAMR